MNLLKLERKKTNIKTYCFAAAAIFLCLLGLTYIFAWVPRLGTADPNATALFSTYEGISAMSGAIALMAFSALASAMGYRYVIKEFSGTSAVLLFTYPIDRKKLVWAKVKLLTAFISVAVLLVTIGCFVIFAVTGQLLSLVNDTPHLMDFLLIIRNVFVLACLINGIALCALRVGFIKKSNSVTVICAIVFSMLLVNLAADINNRFKIVLGLSVIILLAGLLLVDNMARKVENMEV